MVLDPLGAFSVACNVLQIVETSLRVLGKTAESYRSGAPDEVGIIVSNLHTIQSLNDDLRGFVPDSLRKGPLSPAELRLVEANEQCLRVSGDFIRLVDGLKVTKKSLWHSVGSSVKTMWYQDKLATFERAVSESRANLTLAFLLLMHERSLAMQSNVITATTDVETRIVETFKKHTGSLESEIGRLTSCLNDMSLENCKAPLSDFSLTHQMQLTHLSEQLAKIWEHQRASDEANESLEASRSIIAAQQRLLQSLRFPQMQDRKEEISSAYKDTYEWLFQAAPREQKHWHNFLPWARRADDSHSIYWIHGKPGSGKSTLARFVYDRLDVQAHLCPWAESRTVIKAAHFFWNPGTAMQKSWSGMLQSLLFQLLDNSPELSETCVTPSRWRTAMSPDSTFSEWSESELLHAIRAFVRAAEAYVFFLIDGLDELQGDEERREELIDFILELATHKNVKLCISSRPDNIFRDAFEDHPRLKLESLTHDDIKTFVTERFSKQRRIQMLSRGNPRIMNDLIAFLVDSASGVFLWVRLVVHELLRAARDGATFAELVDKAHQIPRDLDSYFTRFIDSIPVEYRQEASQLFQITLHNEESFVALHGLRLLDLSYLGSFQHATQPDRGLGIAAFDPNNIIELDVRLDATARRINSRCRGLIECNYAAGDMEGLLGYPELSRPRQTDDDTLHTSPRRTGRPLEMLRLYNRHVGVIHRSLRDFLIHPKMLETLHAYSRGPFNTRLFLCKARLAQIQSLDYEGNKMHAQMALGLSSYVISAIATDDLKYSDESAIIAAQLSPVVEALGRTQAQKSAEQPWYLGMSLRYCQKGYPDFLGVAIDFDLVAYLKKELMAQVERAKPGVCVLDYLLIRRFALYSGSYFTIWNRFPNIGVLHLALELGADPNEICREGISVWARFLGCLDSLTCGRVWAPPVKAQKALVEAVRVLLNHGAHPELPSSWLTPQPSTPRCALDLTPVSTVFRKMLSIYNDARQELLECIDLADAKTVQGRAQRWTLLFGCSWLPVAPIEV